MAVRITINGFKAAADALERLTEPDVPAFLDGLGGLVVSQTQRRIRSEKTAPDGTPWQPNAAGTSILFMSGALDDSLHHEVRGNEVEAGSNLVYAGIHQNGGTIEPKSANALAFTVGGQFVMTKKVTMPARPYIGLSSANEAEIISFAEDFIIGDFNHAD